MKAKQLLTTAFLAATLCEEVPVALAQQSQVQYQPAVMVNSFQSSPAEFQPVIYRRRRVVVRRRSRAKSAMIVGGSALGGAAVGGLVGGGKGAAIGALAGGGAGFIYDRKTHKKVIHE